MSDSTQTNNQAIDPDRLDEELLSWAHVTPSSGSSKLSASQIMQQVSRRRRLARVGGVVVTCLLAVVAWITRPSETTQSNQLAEIQNVAAEIERVRTGLDRALGEIALLRNESEAWQRSTWQPSLETTASAVEPLVLDQLKSANSSAVTLDDGRLNAEWLEACRQKAIGHALDEWLAVHP